MRNKVLNYAVFLMLITSVPYLLGYWRQGADWRYTGFVFGVEDGNSYIAKMLSGAKGAWLFRSPYTAYPQQGVIAQFSYLLLGKLAAPPGEHEQLVAIFHVYRWIAGILMVLAVHDFLSVFIQSEWLLWIGIIIATVGGGLGWLAIAGISSLWKDGVPLEFYSPETFGFLSIYGLPHLALGRAFLLWGLRECLTSNQVRKIGQGIRGGLFFLGVGFMQPLTVLIGWAVLSAWLAILAAILLGERYRRARPDWRRFWSRCQNTLISILISSPIIVYTMLAFISDPFLKGWENQNLILSPPAPEYFWGYAIILPFATIGSLRVLKRRNATEVFLIAWPLLLPFLIYAPSHLQRRLAEGSWVAIAGLAMLSFDQMPSWYHRWIPRWLYLSTLPSLVFVIGSCMVVWNPGKPLYLPVEEFKAYMALGEQSVPSDVVLASYETSNSLPAWVPVRTLIGHGPESINLSELRPIVHKFYTTSMTEDERKRLLQSFHVSYVFWGAAEKALGNWEPTYSQYLMPIYRAEKYSVFRVDHLLLSAGD